MDQSNDEDLLGVGAQFDTNQHRAVMNVSMANRYLEYV